MALDPYGGGPRGTWQPSQPTVPYLPVIPKWQPRVPAEQYPLRTGPGPAETPGPRTYREYGQPAQGAGPSVTIEVAPPQPALGQFQPPSPMPYLPVIPSWGATPRWTPTQAQTEQMERIKRGGAAPTGRWRPTGAQVARSEAIERQSYRNWVTQRQLAQAQAAPAGVGAALTATEAAGATVPGYGGWGGGGRGGGGGGAAREEAVPEELREIDLGVGTPIRAPVENATEVTLYPEDYLAVPDFVRPYLQDVLQRLGWKPALWGRWGAVRFTREDAASIHITADMLAWITDPVVLQWLMAFFGAKGWAAETEWPPAIGETVA